MSNPQTLAGMITRVSGGFVPTSEPPPPVDASPSVHLDVGNQEHTVRLPPDAPRFQRWAVFALPRMERPVYLSVADDNRIVDVRVPIVGRIAALESQSDGSLAIAVDSSPRRLVLPDAANQQSLVAFLREAFTFRGIVMV